MTVASNDVIRATARMRWAGSTDIQNSFTLRFQGAGSLTDAVAQADVAEYLEDIYTPLLATFPTSLVFEDIDFFNITQNAPMGVESWPTITAGTGSTDIQATVVTIAATAFTAIVATRGRKSFGPIVESALVDGLLDSSVLVVMTTVVANWITPFNGGTSGEPWVPGVWRRVALAFTSFRDAVVRSIPGHQIRRKQGVGN